MQTSINQSGGTSRGGSPRSLFTFDSTKKYSAEFNITTPVMIFAMGLKPRDKIYLHYVQDPGRCTDPNATRLTVCDCASHLRAGNNHLILPWDGKWMLEYEGTGSAWVFRRDMRISWDVAYEQFMAAMKSCCDCPSC